MRAAEQIYAGCVCPSPELLGLPACAAPGQVPPVRRGGPLGQGLPQQPRSTSSKVCKAAADRRGRSVAGACCRLGYLRTPPWVQDDTCRVPGVTFVSCVWCVALCRSRQPLTTNPSELMRLQQPDPVMGRAGDDVMTLLQACFQAQQKPRTTVYLSGVRVWLAPSARKLAAPGRRLRCRLCCAWLCITSSGCHLCRWHHTIRRPPVVRVCSLLQAL